MSTRTKALFSLSVIPPLCALGVAAWARIYASHLDQTGGATYFVVFHFHALPLFVASALLLLIALVSLSFERRTSEKK